MDSFIQKILKRFAELFQKLDTTTRKIDTAFILEEEDGSIATATTKFDIKT